MSQDYKVGYGKPPVSSQFKKGQSGNPAGRSKGSKNLSTMVSEALSQRVIVNEGGRRRTISKLEAAFAQQANRAASGDPKAVKLMLDILSGAEIRENTRVAGSEVTSENQRALDLAILETLRLRVKGGL